MFFIRLYISIDKTLSSNVTMLQIYNCNAHADSKGAITIKIAE